MNLVYLIDNLDSGGAQRQAVELARHLRRRHDVEVRFAVYRDIDFYGERLREAEIPVDVIPKSGPLDLAFAIRLARWLREAQPDLVHAFLLRPVVWGLLAVRLLPAAHRPVFVAGERSGLVASSMRLQVLQTACYRLADAVTANAAPVARAIHDRLGVPESRLHYLPNGIDLEEWDTLAAAPCPFEVEPYRFHVALVGGLRVEKNHALLLQALQRVQEETRRGWCVWFIGGETGIAGHAERVRRRVMELGLGSLVRFAPPTAAIAAVMRRLDVIVLPSMFEGLPNILLEAMASRLPAIATAVGNVTEMIEDGCTGLVVPPGDAAALAKALLRVAEMTPEARRAMGDAARVAVESRYQMEVVAARYLDLYEGLLSRNGVRGRIARQGEHRG